MENPNNKMLGVAKGLSDKRTGKSGGGYSAHIDEIDDDSKDALLTITEKIDETDPNAYETNRQTSALTHLISSGNTLEGLGMRLRRICAIVIF